MMMKQIMKAGMGFQLQAFAWGHSVKGRIEWACFQMGLSKPSVHIFAKIASMSRAEGAQAAQDKVFSEEQEGGLSLRVVAVKMTTKMHDCPHVDV